METLNVKIDLNKINPLVAFVENTKTGEYTGNVPYIDKITFGRTDLPENIESFTDYAEQSGVILFGLSY